MIVGAKHVFGSIQHFLHQAINTLHLYAQSILVDGARASSSVRITEGDNPIANNSDLSGARPTT